MRKVDRAALLGAARAATARATEVSLASPIHGPRHWRDVGSIGMQVAHPEADRELVFLFACLHDTQRHNESSDPEHGVRAAESLRDLRDEGVVELAADRFDLLAFALAGHNTGATSDDPTVGTCWDADRLTLRRVYIEPHLDFFSTVGTAEELDLKLRLAADVMAGSQRSWEQVAEQLDRSQAWST